MQTIICPKTNIIRAAPLMIKNVKNCGKNELQQTCFDPSKSSPPNEFMIKLYMRMSLYNNTRENYLDDNIDDNKDKE